MNLRKLSMTGASLLAVVLTVSVISAGAQQPADPIAIFHQGLSFGTAVRMPYENPYFTVTEVQGPSEASIKLDTAGNIYIAAGTFGAAPLWHSRDGGKSFRYLRSPATVRENAIGTEGDIAIDDGDAVNFIDLEIEGNLFSRWSGYGDSYEYSVPAARTVEPPKIDDRPWVTYAHGGVYLLVKHQDAAATGQLIDKTVLYRTTDGGLTWDPVYDSAVVPDVDGQFKFRYGDAYVVAQRDSRDIYIVGICEEANKNRLCAASSHDDGLTWTETFVAYAPRGLIAPRELMGVDVDAAGNVYAALSDMNASGCDVYVVYSTDKGATWRKFKANPQPGCATWGWVTAGDAGRIAVAWYHNPSQSDSFAPPANSPWKLQVAVVEDATSTSPKITWGEFERTLLDGGPLDRVLGDFFQITDGPDGRFHVAVTETGIPPCTGRLDGTATPAGTPYYTCVTYVPQTDGPRLSLHAADHTEVTQLAATYAAQKIQVSGSAVFGRAATAGLLAQDNITNDAPSGMDVVAATLTKPSTLDSDLLVELKVRGLRERIDSAGIAVPNTAGVRFHVPLTAGAMAKTIVMQPKPWRFDLCNSALTACERIRGDADLGNDRVVARVPLTLLAAAPGSIVTLAGPVQSYLPVGPAVDSVAAAAGYTVSTPTVTVTATSPLSGSQTAAASLDTDFSGFTAYLGPGLPKGTYTISAKACYGGNCDTQTTAVTIP